jgi:hypothetical protein
MPLRVADVAVEPSSLKQVPEKFLIFYSSIVDGQLWCPVHVCSLSTQSFP